MSKGHHDLYLLVFIKAPLASVVLLFVKSRLLDIRNKKKQNRKKTHNWAPFHKDS